MLPAVDAALHRAVETSLTAAWRGAVRLGRDDGDGIEGKPYVRRLHVESAPADTPPSVVVKRPRLADGETFDARSERPETTKFFTEWACLQLLNEIGADAAPRFYSGDAQQGFLVMEDLGLGDRLDHALLGDDPVHAQRTLVALFQTVGRMHAATIGKRGRFAEILGGLGRKMSRPDESAEAQRDAAIADTFSRLAIDPPRTFFDEMIDITRRSFAAYDVDALLHGDPCPDNCHWVGDRVRLLGFEHSRFGNAFFDGCYPRIRFPTCWCVSRLPADVVDDAVNAWRGELIRGGAGIDDERFERGLVDASIRWAWSTFALWHMPSALEKDREWGLVTVRQRILFRFDLVLAMLTRSAWYPAIAEATQRTVDALSARWTGVPEMPVYPAFRTTSSRAPALEPSPGGFLGEVGVKRRG